MIKVFKKVNLFIFILLITMLAGISTKHVSANNIDNDYYKELEKTQTTLYRDVVFTHIHGETKTTKPVGNDHGLGGSNPIDPNKWYGQQINIVDVPRGQNAMVIPWSIQTELQWELKDIASMAFDYERTHPGYKVIAGINADFYDWHTTKEYPNSGSGIEAREGEIIRFVTGRDAVAIQNGDFTNDQLIYVEAGTMTRTATPHLAIYDDNDNIIYNEPLNKVNAELSDGEVGVLFGRIYNVYALDSNGNTIPNSYNEPTIASREYTAPTIYDGNAFLVKNGSKVITQSAESSFYGKGKITDANATLTTESFDKTSFAIISKNSEVSALLANDVKIRVQYEFTGELEGQQNVMGVYKSMLENGVVTGDHADDYYRTRAPRTIIASKADGTIGLITMDGRQGPSNMYGTNQEEMTKILQAYGYTNAYLLDGGGSSSFIVRNGDKFDIVNSPSDGSIRRVANGLFVVVKEEAYKVENIESTLDSLTFTIDTKDVDFDDVKTVKVTVGDITKPVVDGKVVFEGLEKNTEYNYYLSHDSYTENDLQSTIYGIAATNKTIPSVENVSFTTDEEKIYLQVDILDEDDSISNVVIRVNQKGYPLYDGVATLKKNLVNENGVLEYSISIRYKESSTASYKYLTIEDSLNIYYFVTFDYNCGAEFEPFVQMYESEGALVEQIEAPQVEGKTFKYWSLDGEEYDFSKPLSESITLIAVWEDVSQSGNTGGCSFGSVNFILSLISLASLAVLIIKKNK